MYANLFAWICLFPMAGLCDTINRVGAPCKDFELLDCGGESSMWAICQSRTVGLLRILSAQLDIRYPNRHCRRYGTPENFGLTTSGRSMWTVGWCFGTFFLCLEIDSANVMDFNQTNDQITNITDAEQATAEYMTTSDDITTPAFNYSDNIVNIEQFTTESHVDNLHSYEKQQQLSVTSSSASRHRETFTNEYNGNGLDPRLKFWLIFAIISGGVIIVLLIGVIGYLTMQCDTNTDQSSVTKASRTSKQNYFRQQKLSTSALMPSESDSSTDVYDFIPADKPIHNPYDDTKCKLSYTTSCSYSARNEKSYKTNGEKCEELSASLLRENNKRENNEFMLLLNDLTDSSVSTHTDDVQMYAHATENTYDHLNYSPNVSLSDESTYNHIHFPRNPCINDFQQ